MRFATLILSLSVCVQDHAQLRKIEKSSKGGVVLVLATPDLKDKTQVTANRAFLVHEYSYKDKLLSIVWERAAAAAPTGEVRQGTCRLEPIQISIPGFYEFTASAGNRSIFEDNILYAPKPGEIADLMILHGDKLRATMKRAKKIFEEIEKVSKESKKWPADGEPYWEELKKLRAEIIRLVSGGTNPGNGDAKYRNYAEFSVTHLAGTARFVVALLDDVLEIGQAIKDVPEKRPPNGGGGGVHGGGNGEGPAAPDEKGDRAVSLEEMRERLDLGFTIVAREELSWCALLARHVLDELKDKRRPNDVREAIDKILKQRPDEEMSAVAGKLEKLSEKVRLIEDGTALAAEIDESLTALEKRARGEKKK